MIARSELKRRKQETGNSTKRAKQPAGRVKGRHKEPQTAFTCDTTEGNKDPSEREEERTGRLKGEDPHRPGTREGSPMPRRLCFTGNLLSCGKFIEKEADPGNPGRDYGEQRIYTDIPDGMASTGDTRISPRGGSRPDHF